MRIQQIQYILEIYKTGSISQAAKNLFLSQPNLSRAVKSLEEELGYELFSRGTGGVAFTEKGVAFIEYGRSIIYQLEQIQQLSKEEHLNRFSVINCSYAPIDYAFSRLCLELQDQPRYCLSLTQARGETAIDRLTRGECEMAFVIGMDSYAPSYREYIAARGLQYVPLHSLQCNVNLSKNHPLLATDQPFQLERLYNYPLVDYGNNRKSNTPFQHKQVFSFVNTQRVIMVDSAQIRSFLVLNTHAYSIGVTLPPRRVAQLDWVSIPIPGVAMEIGYLLSPESKSNPLLSRYLELLEQELSFLDEKKDAKIPI